MGERKHAESRGFLLLDPTEDVVLVGLDKDDDGKLIYGEDHYLFDRRVFLPLDEARAQAIADGKLIPPPIEVQKDGARFLCAFGRQRTKSYRRANEIRAARGEAPLQIEAKNRRYASNVDALMAMISENGSTPEDPVSRAEKFQRALDLQVPIEEIAQRVGLGVPQVKNYLKVLDLSEKWRKALFAGDTTMAVALSVVTLPRADQDTTFATMKKDGVLRGGAAVAHAKKTVAKKTKTKAPDVRVPMMRRPAIEAFVANLKKDRASFAEDEQTAIDFTLAILGVVLCSDEGRETLPDVITSAIPE